MLVFLLMSKSLKIGITISIILVLNEIPLYATGSIYLEKGPCGRSSVERFTFRLAVEDSFTFKRPCSGMGDKTSHSLFGGKF